MLLSATLRIAMLVVFWNIKATTPSGTWKYIFFDGRKGRIIPELFGIFGSTSRRFILWQWESSDDLLGNFFSNWSWELFHWSAGKSTRWAWTLSYLNLNEWEINIFTTRRADQNSWPNHRVKPSSKVPISWWADQEKTDQTCRFIISLVSTDHK